MLLPRFPPFDSLPYQGGGVVLLAYNPANPDSLVAVPATIVLPAYRVVTADATMTQADQRIAMDSASNRTITLPDAQASFNRRFVIMNFGSGTLTVQCAGSDMFVGNGNSVSVMTGETLEALGIRRADNSYHYQRS